jgi:lipid-A-disaccharide synthase
LSAEPSGDLQAAALLPHLQSKHPDWRFVGVGGHHSRAAGLELWEDSTLWSVVGITEVLSRLPRLLATYWRIRRRLLACRPQLTVFIDAPALHMRLAGVLQKNGLRTAYYFQPSAWTNNAARLRQIHARVDTVIAPFAFSAEQYRKHGLPVAHVGHPLVDLCHVPSREESLRQLGLQEGEYIALLPGSRTQEIRTLLPIFVQVAERFPQWRFVLPTANPQIEQLIRRELGDGAARLQVVTGHSRLVMSIARAGLIASGSATLEAAILGLPHVLCYKLNQVDYFLARQLLRFGLIRVGFVGLPNLVLQEPVVPEVLQEDCTAERLCRELVQIVHDGAARDAALRSMQRVREALGPPGAVGRVAGLLARLALGQSREEAFRGV